MKIIKKNWILIVLFSLSLFLRVYQLGSTTIYPDEISWMVRGKEAFFALKQMNLSYFDNAWWNSNKESEAIAWPTTLLAASSMVLVAKNQGDVSLNLFDDYVAGRLPLVLLNSLFIVIFYLLSKQIFDQKVSLLGSVLLMLDPIHIGLSRWIINDALLTAFSFCAIATFYLGLKRKDKRLFLAAGLCLGLGFLTKPYAIGVIIPWLVLIFGDRRKDNYKGLIYSLITALLLILIVWPTSWSSPIFSIFDYLLRQFKLSGIGIAYYFMGEVTTYPLWESYIFGLVTRLPAFVELGLLLSLIMAYPRMREKVKHKNRIFIVSIVLYCLVIIFAVSRSNLNQGVRYVLPLWPWLYLGSSFGILAFLNKVRSKTVYIVLLGVIVFSSLFSVVKYFPEYMIYYNMFVGGAGGAQKYDLVGRCLGIKQAAHYVNKCYPDLDRIAILGCFAVTAPYYINMNITTDSSQEKVVITDYSSEQLLPSAKEYKGFETSNPVFVVRENGAILAKIYQQDVGLTNKCLDG